MFELQNVELVLELIGLVFDVVNKAGSVIVTVVTIVQLLKRSSFHDKSEQLKKAS